MADYYRDEYRRARDAPVRIRKETIYVRAEDLPSIPRATASTDLVRRARGDSDISIEEIPREYPLERPSYDRRSTRSLERSRAYDYDGLAYAARYGDDPRRSAEQVGRSRRERPRSRGRSLSRAQELAAAAAGAGMAIGSKELWDRRDGGKHKPRSKSRLGQVALGLAGAAAGDLTAKAAAKEYERHQRHDDDHHGGGGGGGAYGRYEDDDGYPSRPRPNRRKSIVEMGEAALGALGLGAVAGGHHSRSRSRDRDHDRRRRHRRRGSSSSDLSYSSRSRSRRRGGSVDRNKRLQQAAQAALAAAAAEAWRSRKEPGGFLEGDKARRILTAAVGAGGIDALVDKDPSRHEGRHVGEGAIGGLLLNRMVNGSRGDTGSGRRRGSRSRSRSRSRGGALKDIGAAGVAAGVAKKLLDRSPSRSGRRQRHRSSSSSSEDAGPRRRHRRSKSVSDYVNQGMSKLGIKDSNDRDDNRRSSGRARDLTGGAAATGGGAVAGIGVGAAKHRRRRGRGSDSDDDDGSISDPDSEFSLSEEERNVRKLKGKELLTAGLATVATVHAAHEIYESMDKRKKRLKAVSEGTLSPEEAKKQKTLAQLKDAATLGLVGLGVKGVVGSWQETNAKRKEIREWEQKLERHRRIAADRARRMSRGELDRGGGGGGGGGSRRGGDDRDRYRDSERRERDRERDGNRRSSVSGPVYHDGNPYGASR